MTLTSSAFHELHHRVPMLRKVPSTAIWTEEDSRCGIDKAEVRNLFTAEADLILRELRKPLAEVSPINLLKVHRIVSASQRLHRLLTDLTKKTFEILSPHFNKYLRNRVKKAAESNDYNFKSSIQKFANRTRKTRTILERDEDPQIKKDGSVFQLILNFGIKNTAHLSYSLFAVIPSVFYRQYNRLPHPDEYKAIAESVLPFMLTISSGHDDIFNGGLMHLLRRPKFIADPFHITCKDEGNIHQGIEYDYPLQAIDFQVIDNKIELSNAFIEAAQKMVDKRFRHGHINVNEPRTGCSGLPLIPLIHQWCFKVAEFSMFNNPEKIYRLNA